VNILVDLGHPAHVHLFRYAIGEWRERGHEVVLVARDKDIVTDLMDAFGWTYTIGSRARTGKVGLFLELIEHDWRVLSVARKCRVDVMLGTSVAIAHASRFLHAKSIVFNEDDLDVARMFAKLTYPFADYIITPRCVRGDYGAKHIVHDSYHELAYLHPNRFTPDPSVLADLGISKGERFFILRFVALKAAHDIGESGLSLGLRRRLIRELSRLGRVFITTEAELAEEFRPYQIHMSPEKMHDALYYATMLISDSQTMTIEAAVLGTPAIRCNTFVGRCSVIEELEHKYGLTYGLLPKDEDKMFDKIMELLDDENLHNRWQQRRKRMLQDKIDLTSWMVDFVERFSREAAVQRG